MFKYIKLAISNWKLKTKNSNLEKELEQMRVNYRKDIEISFKKFDEIIHELKINVPRYSEILNSVEVLLKEINKSVAEKEKEDKLEVY